jgi:hypothetical protein
MMTHLTEEDLVLHHYGEPGDRPNRDVEEHLRQCAACTQSYQSLTTLLTNVSNAGTGEPPAGYETEVWNRLRARLPEPPPGRWEWLRAPRWAFAAVGVAAVVMAFIAGRYWPASNVVEPPASTTASTSTRDRILLVAVGDHLERSQMVLVELSNLDPSKPNDISAEQESARELVASNRLYRQTAVRASEPGVATVLDELEPILLEIVHSPSVLSTAEFEQIRQRIEDQGLLFKVRVIGSRVRSRKQPAKAIDTRSIS